MTAPGLEDPRSSVTWCCPVDPTAYDRTPELSLTEQEALAEIRARRARPPAWKRWPLSLHRALARLLDPLTDVLDVTGAARTQRTLLIGVFINGMQQNQRAFWGWSRELWCEVLGGSPHNARQYVLAVAYLLCDQRDLFDALPGFLTYAFAARIFGRAAVEASLTRVREEVRRWGYQPNGPVQELHLPLAALLLASRSPALEDISAQALTSVGNRAMGRNVRWAFAALSRALMALGVATTLPPRPLADPPVEVAAEGVSSEWLAWCHRWQEHSGLALKTRRGHYYNLLVTGRWLAQRQPELVNPADWTREAAATFVVAIDQMVVGEWSHPLAHAQGSGRLGQPLAPATKAGYLATLSRFFRDCQDWEWLRRRFDPRRAFATPPRIRALLGTHPRVIAQDIWAKLLWAGLNLTADDLATSSKRRFVFAAYPLAMVRAVALTWLFAGLRADELRRLPVGCVRWQLTDVTVPGTTEVLPKDAVCFLDVPVNKTAPAFTKPVDRPVGEAIAAWEAVRPRQPSLRDRKTGQPSDPLFAFRGKRIGMNYLNDVLIPLLSKKGGVPTRDARGPITSHRARSTIASMLFNAKDPMSLFELKAWLGHRYLSSTQHYVEITPTRLAKSFADADYFARTLRTIDVLADQDAVKSGAAAQGEPWLYYDIGHGYCTHPYFAQCPHRMLCAKCSFYRAKPAAKDLLVESKANLLRLQQEIPLTDEERAVVDEDLAGCERLLAQLADVPALDGVTPRERISRATSPEPDPVMATTSPPPHEQ